MKKEQYQIKCWLIIFIVLLVLSGITAFPLEWELSILQKMSGLFPEALKNWIDLVYKGVVETNKTYPFMAYGTDWLAFAHIVIAVFLFGAIKDPVRNIWLIKAGMINCALVLVLAFTAGSVRGIPFGWQLIDCSFGVFGFLILNFCYRKIKKTTPLKHE
jgi:hypothetical protein